MGDAGLHLLPERARQPRLARRLPQHLSGPSSRPWASQRARGAAPRVQGIHNLLANGDWATTTNRHAACPLRAGMHADLAPAKPRPPTGALRLCGVRRLGRRRVAEPHGRRSGSAAPIRRDSDGLWYAHFAMQARENARLVSEMPQNPTFNL